MATQHEDEGRRILNAIRHLVRALRLFDREAQSKYGISAAQMFVLHALDQDEVLSLNALAERTATDQSSASVVVQRLVDGGYVTRTAKKEDRRHIELRLTPKGRTVIRKSPPPAQQKILAAVESMSPRDRKQFAALFEAFVDEFGVTGKKAPMLFEDEAKERSAGFQPAATPPSRRHASPENLAGRMPAERPAGSRRSASTAARSSRRG